MRFVTARLVGLPTGQRKAGCSGKFFAARLLDIKHAWVTSRASQTLPEIVYRRAEQRDFKEITDMVRSAIDDLEKRHGFSDISPFASSRLPPVPAAGPFPWYEFEMKEDREGFWVAELDGTIVGLSLSWVRGTLWYLAQLFVRPGYQGRAIGSSLMERAMSHGKQAEITNRALVTFAYNPVSISLYTRNDMYPREPLYFMDCPSENIVASSPENGLKIETVQDFQSVRKTLTRIDEKCIGYPREKNHQYLFSLPSFRCFLSKVHNEPVGYAYVAENGRVGPVAATSSRVLLDSVRSGLENAAQKTTTTVGLTVAGSNAELMKMAFGYGMKIRENFLLMSTKPFPNLSNYVLFPTGALL